MCLAIYKPEGLLIPEDHLEEGFISNPHSAGFAVVDDGRIRIFRGFFKYQDFLEAYRPWAFRQALVHFRWATHGSRDVKNCHPFKVTEDLVMIHNGVLDIATTSKPRRSDTWHYVDGVLAPMAQRDPDFFMRPEIVFMGGQAIDGSKFCFLRADGAYQIWNESDGHWAAGVWYSNYSYKPTAKCGYYTYTGQSGSWEKQADGTHKYVPPAETAKRIAHVLEETGDGSDDNDDTVVDHAVMLSSPADAWDDYADQMREEAWGDSDFLSGLPHDLQFQYEDLLESGYSMDELDYIIKTEGQDAITNYHYNLTEGS